MIGEIAVFDTQRWKQVHVTRVRTWTPGLFTLWVDEAASFAPGQFARLGLLLDGQPVFRAYSIATPPSVPLGFYVVEVPDGALTPSLAALEPGDAVWLDRKILGHFTLERVPSADVLWCLATGTGLAPFLSMLADGAVFERFSRVVLVHGVRHAADLGHREEIAAVAARAPLTVVHALTRERADGCLHGRLPALLADGSLEAAAGVAIDARSQVMLCGNPGMITDVTALLAARGLSRNTPRSPGHVHTERYW